MLRSLRQLCGKTLGAYDGDIGHVKDFYLNDLQWAIFHRANVTTIFALEDRVPMRRHGVAVGVGVALGPGVSDVATTLKLTVLGRPLVPVPPMELHGVATNVWVPIVAGVQVKSKGIRGICLTLPPSLLNTTLSVSGFVCAVTV